MDKRELHGFSSKSFQIKSFHCRYLVQALKITTFSHKNFDFRKILKESKSNVIVDE